MNKRISAWMLRQSSQVSCAPAGLLIGIAVVLGVLVYVYRRIILDTLEIIGLLMLAGTVLAVAYAITREVRRYRARHASAVQVAPEPLETVPADADPAPVDMEKYAELLSEDSMVLSYNIDSGNIEGHRTKQDGA